MSRGKPIFFGNGKGHRDPPLRVKRLVCFGERIWVKIKEVVRGSCGERKNNARRKKEKAAIGDKARETHQDNGTRVINSSLDGIRIKRWGEKETWSMITDPENPFGDLTREEEIRITELEKGIGNSKGVIRKWHQR